MRKTPGSQIDLNLALHCNLTTEWVVTPTEEAKIFFKEMLSLIYLAQGNNSGIDSDITSERYPSGYTFPGPTSVKLQAELLRRWNRNKVHSWNLTAGLSLLYSFQSGGGIRWDTIEYANGQTKQYVTFTDNINNYDKPWLNYHISGGHEWVLKSKNIFHLSLKVNLSPTYPLTGTYLFTTGIQPDLSGTFKSSGSYIGLSMAYIFTAVSFRIKEKNQK